MEIFKRLKFLITITMDIHLNTGVPEKILNEKIKNHQS